MCHKMAIDLCVALSECVHCHRQAKNPKGQLHRALVGLCSRRKLGLTGTPLQNSLSDVWALLHIVGAADGMTLSTFEARFGRPHRAWTEEDWIKLTLQSKKTKTGWSPCFAFFMSWVLAVCARLSWWGPCVETHVGRTHHLSQKRFQCRMVRALMLDDATHALHSRDFLE